MKKDKKWVKRGLAFLMSALICFHVGAVPVLANETTSNTVNEALLSQFEKDTSSNPSEEPEEPIPSEDTKDTSSDLSSSEPSENPEEKPVSSEDTSSSDTEEPSSPSDTTSSEKQEESSAPAENPEKPADSEENGESNEEESMDEDKALIAAQSSYDDSTNIAKGTVSINGELTWWISSDGCLTIKGTGEFSSSTSSSRAPWYSYRAKIKTVDVSGYDTSNTTDLSYMFSNCRNLTSLDLSNFNTSK